MIFSYDLSLKRPVGFEERPLKELLLEEQMTQNLLPCSFYGITRTLAPGGSVTLYELIGQVENKQLLKEYFAEKKDAAYFEAKKREADELAEALTDGIRTRTASAAFDAYCRYTYMTNKAARAVIRCSWGTIRSFMSIPENTVIWSGITITFPCCREFYSQETGTSRCQSEPPLRHLFAPFVGRKNIQEFYSLIQLDGYNPLGVEKLTYRLSKERAKKLLADVKEEQRRALLDFATKPFTPGALCRKFGDVFGDTWDETLFIRVIDFAEEMVNGSFGEGYWSDHWTYNLDLILDYLSVFPEQEEEMLYEEVYTTFLSRINVNRRFRRYVETENGLRQYRALNEASRLADLGEKLVRTEYGSGDVLTMTLMEKLILLSAVKFATLDAYGMGIEMEGGKPGWYDALNGMPGLFGSSMAETYELARMLSYTIEALKQYPGEVALIEELGCFLDELNLITRLEHDNIMRDEELLSFWNRINDAKEIYRDKTYQGVSGKKMVYHTEQLAAILEGFLEIVTCGIKKARWISGEICPTYFTYEVPEYEKLKDGGIRLLKFVPKNTPYFLEDRR